MTHARTGLSLDEHNEHVDNDEHTKNDEHSKDAKNVEHPKNADDDHEYDVVIVGGGNAGISLAAYLRRTSDHLSVAVVAPEKTHVYRPLLSYVGGGMCGRRRPRRRQRRVVPAGVTWYRDHVVGLHPGRAGAVVAGAGGRHTVVTAAGRRLRAADLVLCPGTGIDWDAIPGSRAACRTEYASTNYQPDLAPKTWRLLRDLDAGRAVFLVSNRNTPCPGVGLKPLFLAADRWRRRGVLDDIDITVVLESEGTVGLARADRRLTAELDRLGVTIHRQARLDGIDPDGRLVRFTGADGTGHVLGYDALHLAPPYAGHDWVTRAGITDPRTTLIGNDPETLEHPDHPGLWALGDAATLGASSSGGGLRHQVPVVGDNIAARRDGGTYRRYDGYTVAPVPVDRRRLLLAEWDRNGDEVRTLPVFSLARPLHPLLWFDLYLQPAIYWRRLLRGRGLDG